MDFSNMVYSLPGGRPTAAIVLIVLFAALLYAAYRVLFYGLRKLSEKTKTDFDDRLIESMNDPARVLVVVTALFLALDFAYPDLVLGKAGLASLYIAALMLSAAFALDRGFNTMLNWYKTEIAPRTESKLDDELIPVIEKVLMVAVYSLALMMALSNLGIEITPLLAGLGIASLAVALALQDSLGNFFAGINITMDRPLKKGDSITSDLGVEGVVQEIGWRSTKILTVQNNLVVVPNTKLAQSVITNYSLPDGTLVLTGSVGVSYDDDIEHAAGSLKRAIKAAISDNAELLTQGFEPSVRLESFGDYSLNFKFTYRVRNFNTCLLALDAVNRAIASEFRAEGISIPFPVRVLYHRGSEAGINETKGKGTKKKK